MKTSDVLQLTFLSLHCQEPCEKKDLVQTFLQRLLMMDYRARYITNKEIATALDPPLSDTDEEELDKFDELFCQKDGESVKNPIHPMDLQMVVFHCSDSFLKQLIVTKLSQCRYALPLLVPNPFTGKIKFPLWTFRQITKSWKTTDTSGTKISKTQHVYEAETPMVAFFRLGDVSFSKSQLMNSLINEKHQTFFHRYCLGSIKNRLLMDGVVEIAWYCPSGNETDHFTDCVAFCNLHGDAETSKEQLDLLTEMSSVNVVLLSDPKNERYREIIQKFLKDPKPLICLLSEDQSGVTKTKNGKYRIGLKDRNQSDVSDNLRTTITECLSKSSSVFKLEDLYKNDEISKDEDDPECRKGKEAALEIIKLLEGKEISTLKETHLPCQGKLWYEWCQINKDSHRLQGNNLEMQKSEKQTQMKQIREQQQKIGVSNYMKKFISSLNSLSGNEKSFFIKWFVILLDKQTSGDLSDLHHKYNETWTRVLDIKKKHDKSGKMKAEQTELEEISVRLNAATFGLEHIFREMGQIYESFMSIQRGKKTSGEISISIFPKLAAELIKSGLPLELMDGDAAHVPLIWVSAVLDELIKKLGDQRVFVLSVLGIQRSGKSTMLNAMFGLQFAVSAGRCTRGAFMQLVRVSEEMKEQLKFDYVLIVDTEGLRALELAGTSTRHHDNELATFVVGLGNLTLINMNVGDITAGEKNMEGRRRLQEKLDEMTKLAAKEEDSEAECFSDVIAFNVQHDVQYFAQLWEGSPPMAPPNPSYSENVQKLKRDIFKNATKSHTFKGKGATTTTQMRSDMPEFNGNRSQLEKHILKSLTEQENFKKYMDEVLNLLKGNLKHKEHKVMNAVNITTEEVKKSSGDANMWLRSLKNSLTDELSLKEITCTGLEEITDLDFLRQVVCEGLTKMMSEQHKSFNSVTDINMEKFRKKPDEILIEHLCQCSWAQCPFCKAICTNTMENHDGDHSVPFHRVNGINGGCYRYTTNLRADICTTAVESDRRFHSRHDSDVSVPYKQYRTAGEEFAKWSITPDNSELPYWKWFVCRFQTDLEKYYGETFQGNGEIPTEWRNYTKEEAIESVIWKKMELGVEEPGSKCEEKKKLKELLTRLHLLEKQKLKMKTSDALQLTAHSLQCQEPCEEKDLVQMFLQRLLMMDYRARYITTKEEAPALDPSFSETDEDEIDEFDELFGKKSASFDGKTVKTPIHPMDLQMAVFHCSDSFLKQLIVTKLSQCRYALPLLVPNPFTGKVEFPLWTFRQIIKSWKTTDASGIKISKTQHVYETESPMVAFFRLGDVSFSKSQLMNSLISKKHDTFFHRHCRGSIKNRPLMDGVVEIAWYCPSGKETDRFTDCVAFCNLHGDAETSKEQLDILTEMSSVNVVLLSDPKNKRNKEMIQKFLKDPKPLICLLSEDESGVTKTKNGKYRIGLKDRNQSDVSENLRTTITDCLSKSSSVFKLDNLHKNNEITIDEDYPECRKGKEAALKITKQLEGKEISTLKETHLPCQGKLWHEWCQINKDSHRLQGNNLEMQKSEKQTQMKQIREHQQEIGQSGFMKKIVSSLNSLSGNEKSFFIKWLEILMDKQTSDDLSDLHHKEKMKTEQAELEQISVKLNAATFGLEHIFREMGQIYESFMSKQLSNKRSEEESISDLPKLAAELIKSGLPMELMDGDASHVPLIWVSAVLDELIKKLGDQRVFVLSVLGIQSTGKSTMLNAMFGLQFAVSAGRCTRGAFMQLVRVSDEIKEQLKFDYVLIVDTEGLRAPELAGKSTYHHDNELATFVVGLGNLTLINIFGENPAEMHEILQIVVQAFLRMKRVKLNPSCMFVHQNVGDITAGEKNMEGRRRLQEKLDEMTKLAAKEEDSEAECFSDVIAFNVQDDVQYFAQLWEGSPPMAPPNPSYSENVQKLKRAIFTNATKSHSMKLSEFKSRISDLWKALLNENFVFSFKNTLEIAVYRKLETEFGKWTWSLRSAMLEHEEKLHNTIKNKKLLKIKDKDLYAHMKKTKEEVEKSMKCYFEKDKDKDILIQWKVRCEQRIKQLLKDLVKNAKTNLNNLLQQQKARETFDHKKTEYDEKLFNVSKALALQLKSTETDEQVLRQEFDEVWNQWVTELTQDTPSEKPLYIWEDVIQILSEGNEQAAVFERISQEDYTKIHRLGDYSCYILKKSIVEKTVDKVKSVFTQDEMSSFEVQESVRSLINNVIQESDDLVKKICSKITGQGYKNSYIQEISDQVKNRVEQYQSENKKIKLKKEFTLDLCLHVCHLADSKFTKIHQQFRDENDVKFYLEKQKPQYYSIFQNYCRGATTTSVFGELVYNNLVPAILEAVYNKTAIDLSTQMRSDMPEFNGNRSQLEKHILKSLAEQENFEKYMEYVHHPKKHFEQFITENVDKYITENNSKVLNLLKGNLKHKEQKVMNAVNIATEEVKNSCGDANMWMRSLNNSLTDELSLKEITCTDLEEITDLYFLRQVVCEGLTKMMSEQHKSFNSVTDINMEKFRKKPDEILIEHLCQCCWVQCPFCKAICTNTIENHDGDHSVPFHRVNGITGWYYRYTTNLCADICTTLVQSDKQFYPRHDRYDLLHYKIYRTAGGEYAKWSITPDNSELPYWKWFVCRFQTVLEKHYGKTFQGYGEIPTRWRNCTKKEAIESLNEYI
ncbi:interferon-induced very large GTPase 1-like [Trichomycterus rosablanca]|uniref:interferon-induced very large GTPase 1-like n=1 Tax=Trichomycterus rosablanca TaxID=2290929 RepID=UPI002F35CBB5